MALRVLLADESSTIKRVMQLALQDFAVEVKSVHAGVDVVEVAKTFKPDIVFADVLLQKKNGYEVSGDLKNDPELKSIPVVLMWSSFMELDQAAYAKCRADGKLEKPFDVETLRKLVRDNVEKMKGQNLSDYLQFPTNISAPLKSEESQKKEAARENQQKAEVIITPPPPPPPREESVSNVQTETLPPFPFHEDDENETGFQLSNLTATKNKPALPAAPPTNETDDEDWVKQDISRFTLDLSPVKLEGEDAAISFDVQHGTIEGEKQLTSTSFSNEPTATAFNLRSPPPERTKVDDLPFPDFDQLQSTNAHLPVMQEIEFSSDPFEQLPPPSFELEKQLSATELEKIIRAQSKEVIEQVVRKVVPEIATQIIRDEINRLIAEGVQ